MTRNRTLPPFLMEQYLATAHHIVTLSSGSAPENTNKSSRSTDVLTRRSWLFNPLASEADPYEEAEQRLGEFLYRAFRHPVEAEQLQPYLHLFRQAYEEEEDFVEAMQIDAVASAMPDPEMFPLFDEQRGHMLLNYMEDEARFLFETVMFEDRSILDFIAADYAYLNERLAKHYDISRGWASQSVCRCWSR